MQVNSVNYLGSTSFGKNLHNKKKDCPSCNPNTDNSMVSVPRPLYNKLLGMAMLAMVAGGPVAMTSCDPMDEPENLTGLSLNINETPKNPNTYVVGADTASIATEIPTASERFAKMFDCFGITAKTADTIGAHEVIKNGDVIEYSYHDEDTNSDVKLKINQELTTKDALVFDEYNTNLRTGTCGHIIHTMTPTADGFIDKKATLQRWKPPAPEPAPTFPSISTYHSVFDAVGVKEYKILTNGTESIQTTTIPSSETTLTVLGPDGGVLTTLTNVSVTKLKNIDTGLHDVRM